MASAPSGRGGIPIDGLAVRTTIDLGGRVAPLVARVNRRARRLIVRVDVRAGEVLVTAPSRRALPEAIRFAGEKASWIKGELDRGAGRPFELGGVCPLRGVERAIVAASTIRATVATVEGAEPAIAVGGAPEHVNRRLVDWLRREARGDLETAVARCSERLGATPTAIRIRDPRTRWGSCGADGALSFSWRLILAPPDILEYVAAHECAHLIHLDHSAKFWRAVAGLGVDASAAGRWFEAHGAELHRWGVRPNQGRPSGLAVDDDRERRRGRI